MFPWKKTLICTILWCYLFMITYNKLTQKFLFCSWFNSIFEQMWALGYWVISLPNNNVEKQKSLRLFVTSKIQQSFWGCLLTNWYPTFPLTFHSPIVHFRDKLQQIYHMGKQKLKCGPIRMREITDIWLSHGLYVFIS